MNIDWRKQGERWKELNKYEENQRGRKKQDKSCPKEHKSRKG